MPEKTDKDKVAKKVSDLKKRGITHCPTCGRKLGREKTPAEIARIDKLAEISRNPRNKPSIREESVYNAIKGMPTNETFTSESLAKQLDVSMRLIWNVLAALKKEGVLEREGSPRYGVHWRKLKDKDTL